jgi:hypothetical protein
MATDEELQARFYNLSQLLGAYLNQDYTIYGPNLEDAVHAYIDDSPPDLVNETRAEIAKFLALKTNDLDETLERLSHDGHSREPGMGAREYLLWIDGLLAETPEGEGA